MKYVSMGIINKLIFKLRKNTANGKSYQSNCPLHNNYAILIRNFLLGHLHFRTIVWRNLTELFSPNLYVDIKSLHCSEFWSLELQENVGRITSLVRLLVCIFTGHF